MTRIRPLAGAVHLGGDPAVPGDHHAGDTFMIAVSDLPCQRLQRGIIGIDRQAGA